jgi:hypothetical protein
LYSDERSENRIIKNNFEGPPILKDEVRNAIKQMKTGKAVGPDQISMEAIVALEEFGVDIVTNFLNEIYKTGNIPKEMSQSIFIALPKKPGAIDCEMHRTISLMSHMTKLLLRILMKRTRNKIRPEINDSQCGFVEGKGTTNAIYILRTLIERSLEVNKDLYLCFIDYTKAFDKVRHDKIIDILEKLEIDGNDLTIIKNLYWEQTAAVNVNNERSNFKHIKRGVRQGCVLSPDLFSLYSEIIMRHLDEEPGVYIGGTNCNNLRYADDTILMAENENELQHLINIVVKESRNMGLELNSKKTEVMVVSRKGDSPRCIIKVDDKTLKQTNSFKYLGTWITSDGRCTQEIKCRIAQAKAAFMKMKSIITNRELELDVRKRIIQCYIEPILMYGCETWTISKKVKQLIEAAEMWFMRRMLRIPWTDKKSNEKVLEEAETRRKLYSKIRKRQAKFFGHVMRQKKLEYIVTSGKIDGKRTRGRRREKMLDGLTGWMGADRPVEMLRWTDDRENWRTIITDAYRHGIR